MLIAALALMASQPNAALPFYKDEGWVVIRSSKSCTLIGGFTGGINFAINHDAAQGFSSLYLISSRFKSVDAGSSVKLAINFVQNGSNLKSYPEKIFKSFLKFSDPAVVYSFRGDVFFTDFSESEIMAFLNSDGNVVFSFNLDGSRAAVKALKTCSKIENGIDPDDPLAGSILRERGK